MTVSGKLEVTIKINELPMIASTDKIGLEKKERTSFVNNGA